MKDLLMIKIALAMQLLLNNALKSDNLNEIIYD